MNNGDQGGEGMERWAMNSRMLFIAHLRFRSRVYNLPILV
jgi:hypothetical protein